MMGDSKIRFDVRYNIVAAHSNNTWQSILACAATAQICDNMLALFPCCFTSVRVTRAVGPDMVRQSPGSVDAPQEKEKVLVLDSKQDRRQLVERGLIP